MSKKGKSFEEEIGRLEEIVQKLEEGVGVEEAMVFYQEGIKLSTRLESRLSEMERKVYEVKNISRLAEGEDKELDLKLFE